MAYANVGKYLYNWCYLIGHQLTAENANEKNLIQALNEEILQRNINSGTGRRGNIITASNIIAAKNKGLTAKLSRSKIDYSK